MSKDYTKKDINKYILAIKSSIIGIVVTAIFILLFAVIMYITEMPYEYSSILGTVSIALGTFAAAFYTAKKIGNKGFLIGLIVGGITFLLVTLISMIADKGPLTTNTLFHFIIILLSSLIGGIIGVNKGQNRKYI